MENLSSIESVRDFPPSFLIGECPLMKLVATYVRASLVFQYLPQPNLTRIGASRVNIEHA